MLCFAAQRPGGVGNGVASLLFLAVLPCLRTNGWMLRTTPRSWTGSLGGSSRYVLPHYVAALSEVATAATSNSKIVGISPLTYNTALLYNIPAMHAQGFSSCTRAVTTQESMLQSILASFALERAMILLHMAGPKACGGERLGTSFLDCFAQHTQRTHAKHHLSIQVLPGST